MKLILSRKGMDSAWGGCPSPILPDGRVVSFPIPDADGPLYDELRFDDASTYGDVLRSLGRDVVKFPGHAPVPVAMARAHLDPDLVPEVIQRRDGWRPAFGQVGGAQSHLRNQGVGVGDLFLFYGWYRQTRLGSGALRFERGAPHLHLIWGYLQVGEVVTGSGIAELEGGLADHPHAANRDRRRFAGNNTLYVAAETLEWAPDLPGAGRFGITNRSLTLTTEGRTRSVWSLPLALHPSRTSSPMSGNLPTSWSLEDDGERAELRSASIGQEFVVDVNDGIQEWASELIRGGACS